MEEKILGQYSFKRVKVTKLLHNQHRLRQVLHDSESRHLRNQRLLEQFPARDAKIQQNLITSIFGILGKTGKKCSHEPGGKTKGCQKVPLCVAFNFLSHYVSGLRFCSPCFETKKS